MSSLTTTTRTMTRHAPEPPRPARSGGFAPSLDPLRVLRRHWMGIILAGIIGAVLGVIVFFVLDRTYVFYTGNVLFEVQRGLSGSQDIGTLDTTSDEMVFRIAQTETYLLTSRTVLEQAVNNVEIKQTAWRKQFLQENPGGDPIFLVDDAVDDLMKELRTSVLRGSNLFTLSWSYHYPSDVAIVLNAVSKAYMNVRKARDQEIYNKNLEQFQGTLSRTLTDIENLATQTSQYIQQHQITNLESPHLSPLAMEREEYTRQLAQAATSLSFAQTTFNQLSAKLEGRLEYSPEDVVKAENDPQMQFHMSTLMSIKSELQRLKNTRQPGDPMIVNMEQRRAAAETARDEAIKQIIIRNLNAEMQERAKDIERFSTMIGELNKKVIDADQALARLAESQSMYRILQERRLNYEAQRQANLELINEVQLMRTRADAARVALVQEAQAPRVKSFPRPEVILPLGMLLMLGLWTGIVFLRELMDQRVKSASDLSVIPGARVLGGIPELGEDPTETTAAEFVLRKHPFSVLAESYRQAFTPILQNIDRLEYQTVLVAGGLPGAGTTTAVTNLAAIAAGSGKRVVVVDANFRRPRLAEVMGADPDAIGFGDLLTGEATLDQSLAESEHGVSVIGPGTPASRIIDRLTNGRLDGVLAELRGRFDLVILDAPPIVVAGDALVLANKVDAAILVVRAHQEHRGLVARVMNQLAHCRSELLGVLLNRPRGTAGGYLKKNYATMAQYSKSNAA